MTARTVRLVLEYDGTAFSGWQRQPDASTVQAAVEEALSRLLHENERIVVIGAGRTDAGVHALGQVCHFQTSADIPLRAFVDGLNSLLPRDVVVRGAFEAPPTFHAQRSALGKHYRYTILNRAVRSPVLDRHVWWVRTALDRAAMRAAAAQCVGRHDFSAFRATGCTAKTSVREVHAIELGEPTSERLELDVRGSGFLKQMVRALVGTLVEVGRGRYPPEWVGEVLASRDRTKAGPTAPARGLTLISVDYPAAALAPRLADVHGE